MHGVVMLKFMYFDLSLLVVSRDHVVGSGGELNLICTDSNSIC